MKRKLWLLQVEMTDDFHYWHDVTIGVFDDEVALIEAEEQYKKVNPSEQVSYRQIELNTIF